MSSMLARPIKSPTLPRVLAHLGLLLLGALVGIAGALLQPAWFPGGLLLALAGEAGLLLGAARATGSRGGAVAAAAGWAITVILLTASRPEGDFVFGTGASAYFFLLGGMALAVICATLAPLRQPGGDGVRLGK